MELKIKHLINEELSNYSASVMELGQNAGRITWDNAKKSYYVFVSTEEEKQKARDYIEELGAWSKEEIAAWSDKELNAVLTQEIAVSLKDYEFDPESSQVFETESGELYIYIGS
jgi:hypothetical protein